MRREEVGLVVLKSTGWLLGADLNSESEQRQPYVEECHDAKDATMARGLHDAR